MLKSFRYLLFPFSLIYGAVILLRNFLFDRNILKSSSFNYPLICVGNLATGGTGKTPMTEYLVTLLKKDYKTATLSRGYKRKTKGFAIAGEATTAIDIGDEPMQFHQKFPDVVVAVGEERLVAIPQLLQDRPDTQVIILDDAYQHRSVKAGLNILLTEYGNLYSRDLMMPAGDLRDVKGSRRRADIVIVTKCKGDLSFSEKASIEKSLDLSPHQKIFFTEILYSQPYHLFSGSKTNIGSTTDLLLVTGIANPKPLMSFIEKHVHSYEMLRFADHHIFTSTDLKDIKKQFAKLPDTNRLIVTTEKDGVRLEKFRTDFSDFPVYVLPVKHSFLFGEGAAFDKIVLDFVGDFQNK